jgi:hypothetical protein
VPCGHDKAFCSFVKAPGNARKNVNTEVSCLLCTDQPAVYPENCTALVSAQCGQNGELSSKPFGRVSESGLSPLAELADVNGMFRLPFNQPLQCSEPTTCFYIHKLGT